MITVIGLTGVKGSGKTTCFNLIRELNPKAAELTLAGKLKDACAEVFEVDRASFDDPATKEKELDLPRYFTEELLNKLYALYEVSPDFDAHIRPHLAVTLHSPRRIAQYVGTEVLRSVDDKIHCKAVIKNLTPGVPNVVTDIRFWNEYEFFKDNPDLDFRPYYVANYGAEAQGAKDSHVSEKYVLEIAKKCEKIDNNGSLVNLKERISILFGDLIEGKHACL